jgi:tetratricopeptide (TPR) repeat protein
LQEHLNRYAEAEEAYRTAIQLDSQFTLPWNNLGKLLNFKLNRKREAALAYLEALKIDPVEDLWLLLTVCDDLSRSSEEHPEVLRILQQAAELVPDKSDAKILLARLLVLTDQWHAAKPVLEELARKESDEPGEYSTSLFRAIVERSHTKDTLKVLEQTGADLRWRPIYEALKAVDAGTWDYLRRVAPEVRTVAARIFDEIAPSLRGK